MAAVDAPVVPVAAVPSEPEIIYKVSSEEGTEFKVSDGALRMSETMNAMLGTNPMTAEDVEKNEAIPINNIKAEILELVFKWCEEHKGEPIPVDDDTVPKNVTIPAFDEELMKIDNDRLFHLICAANYLNVKGLLNVSCKKVALMAKGKSPEELRVIYGIPTDEEDEAAAKVAKEEAEKKKKDGEKKAIEAPGAEEAKEGDKKTEKAKEEAVAEKKAAEDSGEGTSSA
uniref:Skp1-related protein n=1 Tax=Caenorhabditis tropicalis TaxID=1561998 RepID=A0A1I7SYS6_9PELO